MMFTSIFVLIENVFLKLVFFRLMSASESENDDPDSHLYLNQNQMVNEIGLDHERIRQVVDSVFRNIEQEQSQETRN